MRVTPQTETLKPLKTVKSSPSPSGHGTEAARVLASLAFVAAPDTVDGGVGCGASDGCFRALLAAVRVSEFTRSLGWTGFRVN